jgi:4-amino-4-deoxy-L-arabinose transferase-like glycosyltransferase
MMGLRAMVIRQPALTAFVVALTSRLVLVFGTHLAHRWPLIPDEGQYVELATLAADSRINDFCCGGYGPALYSSTRLYAWQMHGLVELFGPREWILQMPAVLYGAAGAYVVTRIAGKFISAQWALVAGLVMALLPSALLHSSTIMRESLIWLLIAGAAWLVILWSEDRGLRRLVICSVGLLLVVVGLGWLRDQTAVLVAWSLVPVALFVGNQRRRRIGLMVVVLLVGPWVTASGPAGLVLLSNSVPMLGSVRAWMSIEADSAIMVFDAVSFAVPGEEEVQAGGCEGHESTTESGAVGIVDRCTETICIDDECQDIVAGSLIVDNSVTASLKAIPGGLAAFYFRPFPWEAIGEQSLIFRLAAVENLLWFVLYGFALFGIRPLWRRHPVIIVFGSSFFLTAGLGASVTQGNIGTAFRHRLQVLWVVALLAVVGGERLWTRWQSSSDEPGLPV